MKDYENIIESSLTLIEQWIASGETMKEIAEKLGIPYSTFRRYSSKNSSLSETIKVAKDKRNENVVSSLYKCCTGYHYYEEVPTKVKTVTTNADGSTTVDEDVKISRVKKYKGPELNAQKYWLNNRDKAKWKDDPNKTANDKKLTKLKEKEIDNKTIQL